MTIYIIMIWKVLAFLLFNILFNNYVKSLDVESIIGGYPLEDNSFKYQITLNIKVYLDILNRMECAGVLINKQYAVTVANCVLEISMIFPEGKPFKRWYSISLGTHDLKLDNTLYVDVEEIFVPVEYDPKTHEGDLAVLELSLEIDFELYSQVEALKLPDKNTIDENIGIANVSGYGYDILHPDGTGSTNYELKYIRVNVTSTDECKSIAAYPSDSFLCVKTIPDHPGQRWGICEGDGGAPLVSDRKLLGLAHKIQADCVDTEIPSMYTRIKPYIAFIRSVLEGSPLPDTRRFKYPFFFHKTAVLENE